MSESLRLFYGLPLPEKIRSRLLDVQAAIARRAERSRSRPRLTPGPSLHVTLQFLGWVGDHRLPALGEIVTAVAAESQMARACFSPPSSFGNPRRARLIVAPLEDETGALERLARTLENRTEPLGFAPETRRFRPHVTLARLKRPQDVSTWLAAAPPLHDPVCFDRLVLYQSLLSSQGSRYQVLAEAELSRIPPGPC